MSTIHPTNPTNPNNSVALDATTHSPVIPPEDAYFVYFADGTCVPHLGAQAANQLVRSTMKEVGAVWYDEQRLYERKGFAPRGETRFVDPTFTGGALTCSPELITANSTGDHVEAGLSKAKMVARDYIPAVPPGVDPCAMRATNPLNQGMLDSLANDELFLASDGVKLATQGQTGPARITLFKTGQEAITRITETRDIVIGFSTGGGMLDLTTSTAAHGAVVSNAVSPIPATLDEAIRSGFLDMDRVIPPLPSGPTGEVGHPGPLGPDSAKHDHGKPMAATLFEYFPRALLAVAEVSTFGAAAYGRGTWARVSQERYADAEVRHTLAQYTGESRDSVSGLLHAAHRAWNALAQLELELRKGKSDV